MSYYKDMEIVYKVHSRLLGESIKGFLESQGIPAIVDQDAIGAIHGLTVGTLGEVNVLVHSSKVAEASELLMAMENGAFEDSFPEQSFDELADLEEPDELD